MSNSGSSEDCWCLARVRFTMSVRLPLEATALRLEGGTANARRVRKHRARQRDGLGIYRLQLSTVDLEEMLRRENLLPLDPTHEQTERALASFIGRLIELSAA